MIQLEMLSPNPPRWLALWARFFARCAFYAFLRSDGTHGLFAFIFGTAHKMDDVTSLRCWMEVRSNLQENLRARNPVFREGHCELPCQRDIFRNNPAPSLSLMTLLRIIRSISSFKTCRKFPTAGAIPVSGFVANTSDSGDRSPLNSAIHFCNTA